MKSHDIDITLHTGRELSPEEQEYHERYILFFKDHLQKWLHQKGIGSTYYLHFNIDYFPDAYNFRISHISHHESKISQYLRDDISFWNKFFTE